MTSQSRPIIVGAGPTGKGAALFLARAGIATRIIDAAIEPSRQSKALAVNPRTLEILEPTGVTDRMLAIGRPIRAARLAQGEKPIAEISFENLHVKYPFMLALSQATTERLLGEALAAESVTVERGIALTDCRNTAVGVTAELKHESTGASETFACPWLLAADGAHSTVRNAIGVDFPGTSFNSPWYLADLPLATSLDGDLAHVFFLDGGFLFMLAVVDESTNATGPQLWRVISNLPEPTSRLVNAEPAGTPVWESSFHISHRVVDHLQIGNVYLAGDAAHLHSPVGARGMNLGLEDAWVFAELAKSQQLRRYDELRKPIDADVVKRVEFVSRMVIADAFPVRLLRAAVMSYGTKVPLIRRQLLKTIAGLDHPLQFE